MGNDLQESPSLSAIQVKSGLDLILQVMKTTMVKDVDYGVIPGCKKPSLYKPGSEKILTAFRIGIDPEVEDLSTEDEARFRVKARLFHEPTEIQLGKGIGEASSHEEKYKWRKAICDDEFTETPEDRRRTAWKHASNGAYQVRQVRTNKADVANTILKMAKKRAQIDGTLTVTAASAVFSQDIEDLEKEVREAIIEGEADKPDAFRTPEKKAEAPKDNPQSSEVHQPSDGPVISEAQGKRLFAIWKGAGKTNEEVASHLQEHYGLASTKEIKRSDYEAICSWAEKK